MLKKTLCLPSPAPIAKLRVSVTHTTETKKNKTPAPNILLTKIRCANNTKYKIPKIVNETSCISCPPPLLRRVNTRLKKKATNTTTKAIPRKAKRFQSLGTTVQKRQIATKQSKEKGISTLIPFALNNLAYSRKQVTRIIEVRMKKGYVFSKKAQ
jgi:hypothetical protein